MSPSSWDEREDICCWDLSLVRFNRIGVNGILVLHRKSSYAPLPNREIIGDSKGV